MKLFQADFERSERLSAELLGYDAKHGPQLEKDLGVCDEEIDKAKAVFDYAKLHNKGNLWELSGKLEAPQLRKIKIKQDQLNAKDAIARELRAITTPAILGYSQELMAEFSRFETRKVFSVITDKENSEMQRVFEVKHNYFSIHTTQRQILEVVETLRGMDCSSLGEIKRTYDEGIQAIPETFQLETSEGGEELKSFIFDNRAKEPSSVEIQTIWMQQTQFLSELENKVQDWKKEKDQEVVEGLVLKHRGPIVEIDMT